MLTPLKPEVQELKDPSHEARRFRTVLETFERNAELLFRGTVYEPHIGHAALAEAFSNWRQAFDRSRHLAKVNRKDFVVYAAGLMVKELIAAAPLTVTRRSEPSSRPLPDDVSRRLERWPEGYAYASFCVSLASAILHHEGAEMEPGGFTDNPQFWDTFRENALESPANAIAFFDLICGRTPNWEFPDVPYLRQAFAEPHNEIGVSGAGKLK
jgi:hypothetical protein